MKMKLKNLKFDSELLALRKINVFFVSRYRQAMREGAKFPPIVVTEDNRVVSGNHRLTAYLEEYGEEKEINVIVKKFDSRKDEIEFFAKENIKHGYALEGIQRKLIAKKLSDLGMDEEEIARVFNVSALRIKKWGEEFIAVIGDKKGEPAKTTFMPVKRGAENIEQMTAKQYEAHMARDIGMPIIAHITQLEKWINDGWVDLKDEAVFNAIKNLQKAVDKLFEK